MTTEFNPLATARNILIDTRETDPDVIADLIFKATPKRDIPALYRQQLRDVALDAIRFTRMNNPEPTTPQQSSRLTAIRERHVAELDQRVYANGEWKLLGDCTVEDVLDLAAQRHEIAARNTAKAAEFEKLAARMAEFGARTVRDLEAAAA